MEDLGQEFVLYQLLTGILYDDEILEAIWIIIKDWKFNEIKKKYKNVRKDGLKAITPNNQSLLDFTKKILDFSAKGLKICYKEGKDESIFLEPLKIILNSGKSPAETWKKLFLGEWNNNVDIIQDKLF